MSEPIAMRLCCEACGELHIDEGDFATKPHHTHSCQYCGLTWRPAVEATVGVRFLPGFKNDEPPRDDPRISFHCKVGPPPAVEREYEWGWMIDERSLLPRHLRGSDAAATRRNLYALAAGRWGADFGDLTAEQQDRVRRWAGRMGSGRTLEIRAVADGTITLWDTSEPIAERVDGVAAVRLPDRG